MRSVFSCLAVYRRSAFPASRLNSMAMPRLVCISDTHNRHRKLSPPPGDILVHAGDFSGRGMPGEIEAFGKWLAAQPHPHKVVIAGNHDFLFEHANREARALLRHCTYLQ